jgi:hypothetical protein
MTMRTILSAINDIEQDSGLSGCLHLNETTATINNISSQSDFMDMVHTLMLISGLIVTFYGNKIVKPVIFLAGVTFGAIVGTYASMYYSSWFNMNCKQLYMVSTISGIIGGSISLTVYRIANSLLGMSIGYSIGYFIYNMGLYQIKLGEFMYEDIMYWICVGIPSVLLSYICVNKNRQILMILTPIPGALMVLYAIDNLIISNINGGVKYSWNGDTWTEFAYMISWVVMSMCGIHYQNKDHKKKDYERMEDSD